MGKVSQPERRGFYCSPCKQREPFTCSHLWRPSDAVGAGQEACHTVSWGAGWDYPGQGAGAPLARMQNAQGALSGSLWWGGVLCPAQPPQAPRRPHFGWAGDSLPGLPSEGCQGQILLSFRAALSLDQLVVMSCWDAHVQPVEMGQAERSAWLSRLLTRSCELLQAACWSAAEASLGLALLLCSRMEMSFGQWVAPACGSVLSGTLPCQRPSGAALMVTRAGGCPLDGGHHLPRWAPSLLGTK